MQLEVYQTDAEAYEAAAALVGERLVAAAGRGGHATVALSGGRGGRALMVALAARGEVPWPRIEVFFTDEWWLPDGDARRTLHVARESLLAPRGIASEHVHAIAVEGHEPAVAAAAYRDLLARRPALDVVAVELGAAGELAGVAPGGAAAGSVETVVAVGPHPAAEPRVPRVALTLAGVRTARHVVLTATGGTRAAALAAALREPIDTSRRPAQAVLPSPTATWFVDRAAAEPLLRDAQPVMPRVQDT
jgi:6-phosphogluconolactonase